MIRNLKTKELSTKVLVPFLVFAMIIGVFNIRTSEARERNSWRFSERTESLFRAAAYVYYNKQGVFDDNGVTCKPQDVRIRYSDNHSGAWAHTMKWSAYESKIDPQFYCLVTFDARNTRSNACVTFIHEYGHMIGRDHNKDIKSPMYDGYADYTGEKNRVLYNRRNMNVLSRSVCSALRIRG